MFVNFNQNVNFILIRPEPFPLIFNNLNFICIKINLTVKIFIWSYFLNTYHTLNLNLLLLNFEHNLGKVLTHCFFHFGLITFNLGWLIKPFYNVLYFWLTLPNLIDTILSFILSQLIILIIVKTYLLSNFLDVGLQAIILFTCFSWKIQNNFKEW